VKICPRSSSACSAQWASWCHPRRLREAPIVIRYEDRQKVVGGERITQPAQTEFLDEAILGRVVRRLDPAFACGLLAPDTVDVPARSRAWT
jgi:hypothetical protein